jgi:hypothetical protein
MIDENSNTEPNATRLVCQELKPQGVAGFAHKKADRWQYMTYPPNSKHISEDRVRIMAGKVVFLGINDLAKATPKEFNDSDFGAVHLCYNLKCYKPGHVILERTKVYNAVQD